MRGRDRSSRRDRVRRNGREDVQLYRHRARRAGADVARTAHEAGGRPRRGRKRVEPRHGGGHVPRSRRAARARSGGGASHGLHSSEHSIERVAPARGGDVCVRGYFGRPEPGELGGHREGGAAGARDGAQGR